MIITTTSNDAKNRKLLFKQTMHKRKELAANKFQS